MHKIFPKITSPLWLSSVTDMKKENEIGFYKISQLFTSHLPCYVVLPRILLQIFDKIETTYTPTCVVTKLALYTYQGLLSQIG